MTESPEVNGGTGFWGRVLNVDLTTGTIQYEEIPTKIYTQVLSGLGLGVRLLIDRIETGTHPLGPDNVLALTTGVLTDTGSVFTGRFMALGLSPQTGGWGEANCGGYFAPALKRCGIDAVLITGAADQPVCLVIDDDGARLEEAAGLWGKDLIEAEEVLRERHGKRAQAAVIGPGGERLSLMAGIGNDRGRMAGRSGLGAVMGSKNLKAVVAMGTQKVGVADKDRIKKLTKGFRTRMEKGQGIRRFLGDRLLGIVGLITRKGSVYSRQPAKLWRQILAKYGTAGITALSAESGDSPIKNWGGVGYRDFGLAKSQRIGADAVIAHEIKKYGCFSCPIRCGGIVEVPDGKGGTYETHKPEYETLCAFGSLCLNNDLDSIFRFNDLVNRAGLDSISTGATIAFAVECFEEGLITEEDTGGLKLAWGEAEAMLKLTEMIVAREGIGDVLADGVKLAAERLGRGAERFAVHCGGVEPAMHDPKFDPGFGLAYTCEPTPGRHTISAYQYLDLAHLESQFKRAAKIPALTTHQEKYRVTPAKVEGVAVCGFYKMLLDGSGACLFGSHLGADLPLCEWLNAATGWNLSNDEYLVIGERISQLRHVFNLKHGLHPKKDFRPHGRIFGDPPQEIGPAKGITLEMEVMFREYYRVMGWDESSGRIGRETAERLGLTGPPDGEEA